MTTTRYIYITEKGTPAQWVESELEVAEFLASAETYGVKEFFAVAIAIDNDLCRPLVLFQRKSKELKKERGPQARTLKKEKIKKAKIRREKKAKAKEGSK